MINGQVLLDINFLSFFLKKKSLKKGKALKMVNMPYNRTLLYNQYVSILFTFY